MTKAVLFAYPVNDLTIARYLAAKEIDFIGIDLDPSDEKTVINRVNEFREWIEGPKLIGVSVNPKSSIINALDLDGYFINGLIEFPNNRLRFYSIPSLIQGGDYYIINNPEEAVEPLNYLLKTTVNSSISPAKNIKGYLFNPGSEEKIGIYDFDLLDEWLELIRFKGV